MARRLSAGKRFTRARLVLCLLAVLLGGAWLCTYGVQPAGAATFGSTAVGKSVDTFAAERKRVNRYALAEAAAVSKLSIYLAPTGTSGEQSLKGLIYSDSNGKPEALLAASEQVVFHSSNAAGWYDLVFAAPVKLGAGSYWIGVITGAGTKVSGFRYESVSGSRDVNANAYASGPSNPFGAGSSDAEQMSLYATYTAATKPSPPSNTAPPVISGAARQGQTLSASTGSWTGAPTSYAYQWQRCNPSGEGCSAVAAATAQTYPLTGSDVGFTMRVAVTASNSSGSSLPAISTQTGVVQPPEEGTFGKTTIGASADSFGAERKRVNRYTLGEASSVTKLSVYLAPTATAGQQVLKGVIYSDASGKPETLLGVSEALTFASTKAAGWYQLPFPTPVQLAAGNYWIGVISGTSTNVAGFRYDSVSGSRELNANAYASGPSNPFGAGSTDAEQMSLYASYATGTTATLGLLSPLAPAAFAVPGEPITVVSSPDGRFEYVGYEFSSFISELGANAETGQLTPLSPATVATGVDSRAIAISADGKSLYVTNFGSESVSQFARNTTTGTLAPLSPATVSAGSGGHGIAVSPDGASVYVANYNSNTISQYKRNTETGALTPLSPATVATGQNPNGLVISPDGSFVYTADRIGTAVSQYARNTQTGQLTPLSPAAAATGQQPHGIAMSADGASIYTANSFGESVSQFARNAQTGLLTPLSPATVASGSRPFGVAVSPDGRSVYVTNSLSATVSQYARNTQSGALTPYTPASVQPVGEESYGLVVSSDGHFVYVAAEKGKEISMYARSQ